jgi:iron complex transport system ATP-binding protein
MLKLQDIQYNISGKQILSNVNIDFTAGQLHMILGPNGSGKTSLMKIASGQIENFKGLVSYDNASIKEITTASLATYRSYLSQQNHIPFPLKVIELIQMGRYPHYEYQASKKDFDIIHEVIDQLSIKHLQSRDFNTLSGGEQQRVQFARVLAQVWEKINGKNRYLFLDEPLNNLDIQYQKYLLQTIQKFIGEDMVVIMVVHDINWALAYADKVYFLKEGNLVAQGNPTDIITTQLIADVFKIDAQLINVPGQKQKVVVY